MNVCMYVGLVEWDQSLDLRGHVILPTRQVLLRLCHICFSRKCRNNTHWPPGNTCYNSVKTILYLRIWRLKYMELLGVTLGLSYWWRSTGWGCWRIWCWDRHLAVRGSKWQAVGENWMKRDFKWYEGNQLKGNKMGQACEMHVREGNATDILLENFKVKYTFEDVGVNGKRIVKFMWRKQKERVWAKLIWLRIGTGGTCQIMEYTCEHMYIPLFGILMVKRQWNWTSLHSKQHAYTQCLLEEVTVTLPYMVVAQCQGRLDLG